MSFTHVGAHVMTAQCEAKKLQKIFNSHSCSLDTGEKKQQIGESIAFHFFLNSIPIGRTQTHHWSFFFQSDSDTKKHANYIPHDKSTYHTVVMSRRCFGNNFFTVFDSVIHTSFAQNTHIFSLFFFEGRVQRQIHFQSSRMRQ